MQAEIRSLLEHHKGYQRCNTLIRSLSNAELSFSLRTQRLVFYPNAEMQVFLLQNTQTGKVFTAICTHRVIWCKRKGWVLMPNAEVRFSPCNTQGKLSNAMHRQVFPNAHRDEFIHTRTGWFHHSQRRIYPYKTGEYLWQNARVTPMQMHRMRSLQNVEKSNIKNVDLSLLQKWQTHKLYLEGECRSITAKW